MPINARKKAIIALFSTALVGAGGTVFVKIGLKEVPLFGFTVLRFFISALILVPLLWRDIMRFERKYIAKGVGIATLSTINAVFFAFGIRETTATTAGVLYACLPLMTAILSALVLKEKHTFKKYIGIVVGFIGGFYIIISPQVLSTAESTGSMVGNILIACGVVVFAFYTVLSKKLSKVYSPPEMTLLFTLTTIVVHLPLSLVELADAPFWWVNISSTAWVAIIYASLFGTVGFYVLYQYAIKIATPTLASLNFYLQPVATFLWASLLLGEQLNGGMIVGATLVLVGVWLTTRH